MPISMPASPPSVAFAAGVASDYVFRGVSRTDGRLQAFGSLDVSQGDAYGGVWGSNVMLPLDGGARDAAEIDAYAGWRPEAFGYSFDLGAQYDGFTGSLGGLGYVEVYGRVWRAIGPVTGRIGVHYSPDFAGRGGQSVYVDGQADYAITPVWTASAGIGGQSVARSNLLSESHLTWNAGISRTLGDHLSFDVRYVDTDRHGAGKDYGPRLVGQIRASF